jgi:uncharacterized membrane protein YhfC
MVALRQMDWATVRLTGDALAKAQRDVATFWSAPAYLALLGAVERLFALTVHVSLSVMVLQVFTRRNGGWLVAAIGFHWLTDAVAVFGSQSHWSPLAIEALIGIFALVGLVIMVGLRPRGEPLIPPEPEPVLVLGVSDSLRPPLNPSADAARRIDDSRFA